MKIVQKNYLRACIALSSLTASLLAGNNIAFADETDAATSSLAPIETTTPALSAQLPAEPSRQQVLLKRTGRQPILKGAWSNLWLPLPFWKRAYTEVIS